MYNDKLKDSLRPGALPDERLQEEDIAVRKVMPQVGQITGSMKTNCSYIRILFSLHDLFEI